MLIIKLMRSLKSITIYASVIFAVLIIVGLIKVVFTPLTYVALMHFETLVDFPNLFANWDGNNYQEIALRGYQEQYPHLYGFMPLYPLFIRIASFVLINPVVAAVIISLVSLVLALWLLQKLIKLETKDEKVSWRTIQYMLFFPTAFFFFIAYTESLFLLLSVATFYFLKKKQIFWSSLVTSLATITRITGLLLIPFVIWEIWKLKNHRPIRRLLAIFITPFALILFMVYLFNATSDPLKFIHTQQSNFQTNVLHNPFLPLASYLYNLSFLKIQTQLDFIYFFDFAVAAITPILLIIASKKLPSKYILYGLSIWLLHMTTGKTNSFSRYMLIVFPMFIGLSLLGKKRWFDLLYRGVGFGLMIILFMWFLVGNWVA